MQDYGCDAQKEYNEILQKLVNQLQGKEISQFNKLQIIIKSLHTVFHPYQLFSPRICLALSNG